MSQIHRTAVSFMICASVLFFSFVPSGYAYDGPFGPIHVAANRSAYNGSGCPIEIVFTATINFVEPHGDLVFNYHWERSDGGKTAVQVVHVSRNERSTVIHETWRAGAPGKHLDASMTLFVNSGNTHLSESSRSVSVTCR